MVGGEIVLEIVDKGHGLTEHRLAFAAIHEQCFRTEHFRHLGEDGGSPPGDELVGKGADGGVGRNAAEAVAAAALETDDQLLRGNGDALPGGSLVDELPQQRFPCGQLILHLLAHQRAHTGERFFPQIGPEGIHTAVFTAQAQHQHAPGIGVADQVRQQTAGRCV